MTIFIPYGLPGPVSEALSVLLTDSVDSFAPVTFAEDADVRVTLDGGPDVRALAEWIYAVVVPFPTLTDEVAWADVAGAWGGVSSGPFAGRPLLLSVGAAAALATVLGDPTPGGFQIIQEEDIVQSAWDAQPIWAIVPFDQLEPRWKVLRVDGISPIDKNPDMAMYPLVVRVGATGLDRGVARLQECLGAPLTNLDPAKMSVVLMTGVTALTRGTATRMERHGATYPGEDIRDVMLEADITHISNEVSFAENCPPPANSETLVFCSAPHYIELIEDVDIDVVELTGNHLLDWGVEAMNLSLRMYEERGISYFGGGWDLVQAQQPLTLTHGVHTFGFVGCNPVGPASVWATADRSGAAPCDYDVLSGQVRRLREGGIIPIVTLQYLETYEYFPTPQQSAVFQSLAEAGAAIVSGSQAHQPQGFGFHAGGFIHYGLGNLFFDQMWSLETRQEFLDRHVFYDGQHISTQVQTAILEDYARPRPMTADERTALLRAAFEASGWRTD